MDDFRTLKLLDKGKWVFEKLGADYPVLRKILAMKLTMDQRRVPTILGGARRKQEDPSKEENRFMKSLWVYSIFGLLLLPLILLGEHYLVQMTIFFAILMFIIMTSLVSDFSAVLLDLRDRHILLAKPVGRKTLSLAKAVHVAIYLFFLTGSLAAIPLIAGLIRHGPVFFLVFLVALFFADLLILAATAMVYYFILRFFDGEKLRDVINYVQILLSVSLALGYQLVGRSFELIQGEKAVSPQWWQALLPPAWFGSLFEAGLNGFWAPELALFALLAIAFPIAAFALYIKLMPSFEGKMQKLSSGSGPSRVKVPELDTTLSRIICPNREERAFYRFAAAMMKTERDFRLKVYPSIGLSVVLPVILILNRLQWDSFESLAASKHYLSIYMAAIVIPTSIIMLKYSGRYKASWLFQTAPLRSNSFLYSGTLKAFLVRLFLPVFALTGIIFCGIFGLKILPDIVGVFLASIFYCVICTFLLKGSLPFSESFEASQESEGWKTIIYLIPIFVLMGIHYLFTLFQYGNYLFVLLMLLAASVSWRIAGRKIWT
ncbi:hypothetical protein D1B31_00070 [Neobacillus notoginsengisoli]|uniref:Uncharacterized protein n=1 Tax=Neobacillus notoginsengisoli TaxID=1578198 RepID=A0A417YYV9_9BACI|nr:hypothetical protein [Neobacillus notoginsengisoli]RHW43113.1 hypothetical protein D1B31_00070 [Neobacillus notoginsengisoli]